MAEQFRENPLVAGVVLREWYSDTKPDVDLSSFKKAVLAGRIEQSAYYPRVGTADWALDLDDTYFAHRAALVDWMRANGLQGEPRCTRHRILHYLPGAFAPLHADDQRGPVDHYENQAATLLYVTGQTTGRTDRGAFKGGSLGVPRQGKVFEHYEGQMLVTPSFTPYEHEIHPVEEGRRIVIVRHWSIVP